MLNKNSLRLPYHLGKLGEDFFPNFWIFFFQKSKHTLEKKMEDALVEWLNTFEFDRSCDSIYDIVDGVILVKVMSQVRHFTRNLLYRFNETSSRANTDLAEVF